MKRRRFLGSLIGASVLTSQYGSASRLGRNTMQPAARRDEIVLLALDPDDFPTLRGGQRQLEPAEKSTENPVLPPRPGHWDGTRCKVYGTVLYDPRERLFKMWYSGTTDTPDSIRRWQGSPRNVGYAYSYDGVRWERPRLALIDFNGSKENNLVLLDAQAPNVFLTAEETDPDRRYLMITEYGIHTNRTKLLYSSDGFHWKGSERPPFQSVIDGRTHEPFCVLYDPKDPNPDRRWKCYSLLHVGHNGYRGRAVGLFLATEPTAWTEYVQQPIMSAFDGMESEIHISHVARFYDTYVMLYDAMEPNQHTQTEIAVSHDGIHFQRIQNGIKVIPNGKPGDPDAGMICVSPHALFTHEGKIWWYYTISPNTYQTDPRALRAWPWYRYTGLANWRQDGFASLRPDPAFQSAQIISRRLQISQDGPIGIWLNTIAPAAGGGIGVELLDATGNGIAACRPWMGDALAARPEWQGPTPVLKVGQEVMLRLTFVGGSSRLYAMGVYNAKRASARSASLSFRPMPGPRADKRVRWTFSAQLKVSGSPICDNNQVYFGSWDQNLYALDSETGTLRWKFATGNAITTTPAVHEGSVYTVSHDGNLYCLEGTSGRLKWRVPVSNNLNNYSANLDWVDSPPAIGAYTVGLMPGSAPLKRLFVGCHNRDLHAFNLDDGTEEWRFPTYNWILCQPAIDTYTVFISSLDGRIYAVDARCGAALWMYKVGKYVKYSPSLVSNTVFDEGAAGSPLVVNDVLYCGADDGFLYALDSRTGRERWVFQTGKWIWGRPLLIGEVLVVASADTHVYGLNADSGKRIWELQTENANYANVVLHGKLALIACTSGRLYAVDPATGDVAWTFLADSGLRAGPTVGANGTIYLPTCKGTVYACLLTPEVSTVF